jgi:hypothetical protein
MNRTLHLCLLLAVPVLLVTGGIGVMILGGSVLAFPPIIIRTLLLQVLTRLYQP